MADSPEHLSILFAELMGNVRLYERLRKTEAQSLVERYHKRIQLAAEGFSGKVAHIEGDELMAVFAEPASACQAAIEMQKRIGDLLPVSAVKLAVRIGFSYASAIQTEAGYSGEALNIAACLTGSARPGQILTNQLAVAALSPQLKALTRPCGEVLINRSLQKTTAFEVLIPKLADRSLTEKVPPPIIENGEIRQKILRLTFLDTPVLLDQGREKIRIGRLPGNDILVQTPMASRNHAHIERFEHTVVLVDHSQNGTYITREGEPEVFVHQNKCTLFGHGMISFGSSIRDQMGDFVEFDFCDPEDTL